MDRRKFIANIGAPVFATCAVCLAACSKSGGSPSSGNPGTTPANVTIDLSSQLQTVGSSVLQSGIIVVRLAAANDPSSFTAVQSACTHQGTTLNYVSGNNDFECPLHGSRFTTNGAVLNGPATTPLKKYTISITGNTMTITG